MNVSCPSCGAPVEFRFDDSMVRVCAHCRSAVVRTDRGVETLGRFADLVPIPSALKLFAEGRYGTAGFLLIGMAQLRHASGGLWQEWYAKLDGGQWAWLTEAQGRLYLTFERPDVHAPSIAQLAPGTQLQLANATFTVAERGSATYASALGEIPYRLVPQSAFHFVDLSDGHGGFATIDYNDGSESPSVYIGYQVTPQGLGIAGGESQAQVAAPVRAGGRLACPQCNGSLELRAPDHTLRVACPYCGTLVSVETGTLSIIARQGKKPEPDIALGSTLALFDGPPVAGTPPPVFTVIGYLERSAFLDAQWWPFEEYLLHEPSIGFRWLVCSDGHWSYVQPVAAGAVSVDDHATYDGVKFARYADADLRVDYVLGECYWRVEVGERVRSQDYIAPPAMLSCETSRQEQNWSLSTYLPHAALSKAAGKRLAPPPKLGVAPNQPYGTGVGKVAALLIVAFCALAIAKAASTHEVEQMHQRITVPYLPYGSRPPAVEGGEPGGNVTFSEPFHLDGGKNVAFHMLASVNDNWVYAAFDLVNDGTGSVISFDKSIEYYSGYDDGAWTEGSTTADQVIEPVTAGSYVLRVEAQHGKLGDVELLVWVRQDVFRWPWLLWAGGALLVLIIAAAILAKRFRLKQWENSNASQAYAPAPPGSGRRGEAGNKAGSNDDGGDDDDD